MTKIPSLNIRHLVILLSGIIFTIANRCAADGANHSPVHWRPLLIDRRINWAGSQESPQPSTNDLADLNALAKAVYSAKLTNEADLIEQYINTNPNSGWKPDLENFLASYYFQHGQFTRSLALWEDVWEETKQYNGNSERKHIADVCLANWTRLLASLGRYDQLTELFNETKGRVLDRGPLSQKFIRTKEAYEKMRSHPEVCYRCGTVAMMDVCYQLYKTNFAYIALNKIGSSSNGFTLNELTQISKNLKLGLIPVKRSATAPLIVPSVVNWKQHHYGAIVSSQNGIYTIVDPTMGQLSRLTEDEIKSEASGYYMIPSNRWDADCSSVSSDESQTVYGKGNPYVMADNNDQPCTTCPCPTGQGPGGGSGGGCGSGKCFSSPQASSVQGPSGMPTWSISEPYINLWLQDEPLGYQPAFGPRVSFKIYYHERDETDYETRYASIGANWSCDWFCNVISYNYWYMVPGAMCQFDVFNHGPYQGRNYYNNYMMTLCTNGVGAITGITVALPDGSQKFYMQYTNAAGEISSDFCLMKEQDPQGNALRFYYFDANPGGTPEPVLTNVVDATGLTNTISYTYDDFGDPCATNVTDAFGRSITLQYDESQGDPYLLTNITDVAGLSSSMHYDDNGFPTNVITPYGTNTFTSLDQGNSDGGIIRGILAQAPDGGQYLYTMNQYSTWILFPDALIPTNTPLNTLDPSTDIKDSFFWGPRQYPLISSTFRNSLDLTLLTTNDFISARIRHWLGVYLFSGEHAVTTIDTLALEQEPSPDGVTYGKTTWYDYTGKGNLDWSGDQILPAVTALVMPDGSTSYVWDQRDVWGHVTNEIAEWFENGQQQFRTNTFVYSTNGFDVLCTIRPDGITNAAYGYDNYHSVLSMTNAIGEVTSYTYNTNEQLTSTRFPNGLLTTNIYRSDGFLAQEINVGYNTNIFVFSNALVYSHTDERGLSITNTWDKLSRLTSTVYPDGTCMSNVYTYLDMTATKDRLGNWTYFGYDSIRRKIAETNANNAVKLYDYCTCGSLESAQDAMGNITYFNYDNSGRLTNIVYPDGYSINRFYDSADQLFMQTDSSGMGVSNYFNNHGLLIASSNNVGLVRAMAYDVDDRVTNSTDANNVSIGATYDDLNRLLKSSYSDGGVESYGYAANTFLWTSYTNQTGKVWLYAYDGMDRKTNEVCLFTTTNYFNFDGAGDLLALTDGKKQTTSWGYDQYGRVTNKLDAIGKTNFVYQYDDDNRLTNRWTPAKGSTAYGYDPVGNLTDVNYSGGTPSVSFSYDADNRLTVMLDGLGTTAYSYDEVGQLLSEGGLWPDDTVSNAYQNRLRMETSQAQPGGSAWTEDYEYDVGRRLTGVESPAGIFNYTYDPVKLQRVNEVQLPGGAYITNSYDSVARTLSTDLFNNSGVDVDSASYVYNAVGQRVSETNTVGDYCTYTYDNEGELTTALGSEANGNGRNFDRFSYVYDPAENLKSKTRVPLGTGNVITYLYNSANQITNSVMGTNNFGTWQAAITVSGSTTTAATNVTVNGQTGELYADNSFDKYGWIVTNGVNVFTAIASDVYGNHSTNTSSVNVIITNNAWAYDANGNLTSDGVRQFAYDDENELISVCVSNAWSNSFAYDGRMRRRIEQDFAWQAGSWVETKEVHFIYDGDLVIEERNANNNSLVNYTRGNDLSGTFQGAGGIGGLLARTTYGQEIPGSPATSLYHADGNGNVTCLIYTNQQIAAKYLYDPYGNTLAMYGPLMNLNKYRFSSKEWNENAGLYYYLYRFYDPNLQRWLNRDPWGELGFGKMGQKFLVQMRNFDPNEDFEGPNLYAFIANQPTDDIDALGLGAFPPVILRVTPCPAMWDRVCRMICASNGNVVQSCVMYTFYAKVLRGYRPFKTFNKCTCCKAGQSDE